MLSLLCAALAIDYTDAMLRWSAGRRDTDGVGRQPGTTLSNAQRDLNVQPPKQRWG